MSRSRHPKRAANAAANDNVRRSSSLKAASRLPEVVVRFPNTMPVQIVEVEVLAELLDSLPAAANDNGE